MERGLSVIIKPTLHCGMGCHHCYHSPEELSSKEVISFERLEKIFEMASRDYSSVWFIWHGGEPLELPFSFWKKAIELQKKYFGSHRCGNTIQTNGAGLNRRMIDFCRKEQINIGISHEGPCDGLLRKDCDKIESLIGKMSSGQKVFSVSSTISAGAEDRLVEIYDHFRGISTAVSMNPVIPAGCTVGHPELVPDTERYIESSIRAFDSWLYDRDAPMPLSPQFLYVLSALGNPQPSDCAHSSCLTNWICLYPDGSIYPCGKPCPKNMCMGNIDDFHSIGEMFLTDGFAAILEGTIERRNKCASCEIYDWCQGGCSMDAYWEGDIADNGNPSCRIFKEVFVHIKHEMDAIIAEEKDLSQYNKYVRDAVLAKLTNPVMDQLVSDR